MQASGGDVVWLGVLERKQAHKHKRTVGRKQSRYKNGYKMEAPYHHEASQSEVLGWEQKDSVGMGMERAVCHE